MTILVTNNLTGKTEEKEVADIEFSEENVILTPTSEERLLALESAMLELILGGTV